MLMMAPARATLGAAAEDLGVPVRVAAVRGSAWMVANAWAEPAHLDVDLLVGAGLVGAPYASKDEESRSDHLHGRKYITD
jgi:hypothetical protein